MKRNPGLDLLRCFAVLLVLIRHFEYPETLARVGWVGVDLFFVLSGFLVSGLLFKEYKACGRVDLKRFFIRRGLKIYPSFYFFLICGFLLNTLAGEPARPRSYITEMLFLQSYFTRVWNHTWSIAVEEHFYILLIFLVWAADSVSVPKFTARLKWAAVTILFLSLSLRIYQFYLGRDIFFLAYRSHFRMDSLMAGVLLSVFYHFDRERLLRIFNRYKPLLLFMAIAGTLPFFWFGLESIVVSGFGFSLLWLIFAIVVLYAVEFPFGEIRNPLLTGVVRVTTFIGFFSYNIYLWHMPVYKFVIRGWVQQHTSNLCLQFAVYLLFSVFAGWLVSVTVEKAGLLIRAKYFPSTVQSPIVENT